MCELFGVSSKYRLTYNEYLKEFFSHSINNPHGWGLATFSGNQVQIEKEPIEASKSNYLKERLTVPVSGTTIMAHIRRATVGSLTYANCHPFRVKDVSGRVWTIAHNGTIFNYEPLDQYSKFQHGSTDSERVALYIIDQINRKIIDNDGHSLTKDERFAVLEHTIISLSPYNKLNILIYDGDRFYVHKNCADTLYYLQLDGSIFFATVPVCEDKGEWKPVKMTRLYAYEDGHIAQSGKNHGFVYRENQQDRDFLYTNFLQISNYWEDI